MIGYRFLLPAEEEMTEASGFYETATSGLGADFLDEVERVVNILREHPELGQLPGRGLRRDLLHRFPFSLIQIGSPYFTGLPPPAPLPATESF